MTYDDQVSRDLLGRSLRDLRISVTDRCNFRCTYCMPKEIFTREWEFLSREQLLDFEEIGRLVRIFAALGVHKVRITGGFIVMEMGFVSLDRTIAFLRKYFDPNCHIMS